MSTEAARRPRRRSPRGAKTDHDPIRRLPLDEITPSPENHELYRPILPDAPDTMALAESIGRVGILEPLVVTADRFIISGHRRYAAARLAGLATLPCRVLDFEREDDTARFRVLLAEHELAAPLPDHEYRTRREFGQVLTEDLVVPG